MPRVDRRRFLQGAGALVALPVFESLGGAQALAAGAAEKAPLRTAFIYFPNGAIPANWWPKTTGKDFEWSRTLAPLAKHKEMIQVLGGLDNRSAEAGPDGAGDHARGNGTFLTAVRLKKSASDVRAGVSIDQAIAKEVAGKTRFSSLELTCDVAPKSGGCDSGYACAYQHNLSWSSATTPKSAEANPRAVFERLFGPGKHGERGANLVARQQEDRSVLDFVLDDARAMTSRLGNADKAKLDQYLTSVREIEQRIPKPGEAAKTPDPAIDTPPGVPAEYAEHMSLLFEMLALAFQTDSTRVASFLLAHDGSNRSFEQIGISEGHHDLTHHMNRAEWMAKVADIDLWYARQFAKFLDKLKSIPDVDGRSLLANSAIVYGSGNADANRHTHSNLPVVVAGGGGGLLKGGRFVKHGGKPLANLYVSLAQAAGAKSVTRFGDSTGTLSDL